MVIAFTVPNLIKYMFVKHWHWSLVTWKSILHNHPN